MAQYEVAILYDPGLEVDLSKAEDRVLKIFSDNKGKLLNQDNWGKRKLAYPIKGHEQALYVFYTVEFEPTVVKQVETILNITTEIIRFSIIKLDLKAIEKAEKLKKEKKLKLDSADVSKTERTEEEV